MTSFNIPEAPWAAAASDIAAAAKVNPDVGLDHLEVTRRRARHGPNELPSARKRSALQILVAQFRSLVVLLLAVAALISFAFAQHKEGAAILAVLAINAMIGFAIELRATRSMDALRKLATVHSSVRRNGHDHRIPATDLVPGDIVVFEGGDIVAADMRIIDASLVQADESMLTGESLPVDKSSDPVGPTTSVADQTCMLFKGALVVRGSGTAIVTATGLESGLGQIASMVERAEPEATPLEQRLEHLGRSLVWATLAMATFVFASGLVGGMPLVLVIETAIALAVAAVPEGLPVIATIALARGMLRMSRRNALVRRLSSVETLGATQVICTDKTGTLTENRLTVTRLALAGDDIDLTAVNREEPSPIAAGTPLTTPTAMEPRNVALILGSLCSNAQIDRSGTSHGDPLEVALLAAASQAGLWRDDLLRAWPEIFEIAFDPNVRMMGTVHNIPGSGELLAVKGAAEAVVAASDSVHTETGVRNLLADERNRWLDRADELSASGLRTIAVAYRIGDVDGNPSLGADGDQLRSGLTMTGLIGLVDPPRAGIREAIVECHRAGIRVVMVTGDHPVTATSIAHAVGISAPDQTTVPAMTGQRLQEISRSANPDEEEILQTDIFARVDPQQKLDLIQTFQNHGNIVAMTGDGVNDAPALTKADIGIAMGKRGTEVARESASLVLQDDAFATIVFAIGQGRVIFDNIRRFVVYLLSCNISEILVVGAATMAGAALPLLPLQILFLNLVTDVFPALALGVGKGNPSVMDHPPRPMDEPIIDRRRWFVIAASGLALTASVLSVFFLSLSVYGASEREARTIAFLALAIAQIFHVFNMRDNESPVLKNEITSNPYVWGAVVLSTTLVVTAVVVAPLSQVLELAPIGNNGWSLVIAAGTVPTIVIQMAKTTIGIRQRERG